MDPVGSCGRTWSGEAFVVSVRIEPSGSTAGERASVDHLLSAMRDAAGQAARALRKAGGVPVTAGAAFMQSAFPAANDRGIRAALATLNRLARTLERVALTVGVGVAMGTVFMETRPWFRPGPAAVIGDPVGRSRCLAFLGARHGFTVLLDDAAGRETPGARVIDLYRSPDRATLGSLYGFDVPEPVFPAEAFNRAFALAAAAFYEGGDARDEFAACLAMKPGDEPVSDFMRLPDKGARPQPPSLRWG